MKMPYLFPGRYKKLGWIIMIPSIILGLLSLIFNWEPDLFNADVPALFVDELFGEPRFFSIIDNNILDEILGALIIASSLMVAFSREPDEDEFIAYLRLESLVWATYVNYAILLFAILFVYGGSFFWVMVFNIFTILIFFIIRFNWSLWKLRKSLAHEE